MSIVVTTVFNNFFTNPRRIQKIVFTNDIQFFADFYSLLQTVKLFPIVPVYSLKLKSFVFPNKVTDSNADLLTNIFDSEFFQAVQSVSIQTIKEQPGAIKVTLQLLPVEMSKYYEEGLTFMSFRNYDNWPTLLFCQSAEINDVIVNYRKELTAGVLNQQSDEFLSLSFDMNVAQKMLYYALVDTLYGLIDLSNFDPDNVTFETILKLVNKFSANSTLKTEIRSELDKIKEATQKMYSYFMINGNPTKISFTKDTQDVQVINITAAYQNSFQTHLSANSIQPYRQYIGTGGWVGDITLTLDVSNNSTQFYAVQELLKLKAWSEDIIRLYSTLGVLLPIRLEGLSNILGLTNVYLYNLDFKFIEDSNNTFLFNQRFSAVDNLDLTLLAKKPKLVQSEIKEQLLNAVKSVSIFEEIAKLSGFSNSNAQKQGANQLKLDITSNQITDQVISQIQVERLVKSETVKKQVEGYFEKYVFNYAVQNEILAYTPLIVNSVVQQRIMSETKKTQNQVSQDINYLYRYIIGDKKYNDENKFVNVIDKFLNTLGDIQNKSALKQQTSNFTQKSIIGTNYTQIALLKYLNYDNFFDKVLDASNDGDVRYQGMQFLLNEMLSFLQNGQNQEYENYKLIIGSYIVSSSTEYATMINLINDYINNVGVKLYNINLNFDISTFTEQDVQNHIAFLQMQFYYLYAVASIVTTISNMLKADISDNKIKGVFGQLISIFLTIVQPWKWFFAILTYDLPTFNELLNKFIADYTKYKNQYDSLFKQILDQSTITYIFNLLDFVINNRETVRNVINGDKQSISQITSNEQFKNIVTLNKIFAGSLQIIKNSVYAMQLYKEILRYDQTYIKHLDYIAIALNQLNNEMASLLDGSFTNNDFVIEGELDGYPIIQFDKFYIQQVFKNSQQLNNYIKQIQEYSKDSFVRVFTQFNNTFYDEHTTNNSSSNSIISKIKNSETLKNQLFSGKQQLFENYNLAYALSLSSQLNINQLLKADLELLNTQAADINSEYIKPTSINKITNGLNIYANAPFFTKFLVNYKQQYDSLVSAVDQLVRNKSVGQQQLIYVANSILGINTNNVTQEDIAQLISSMTQNIMSRAYTFDRAIDLIEKKAPRNPAYYDYYQLSKQYLTTYYLYQFVNQLIMPSLLQPKQVIQLYQRQSGVTVPYMYQQVLDFQVTRERDNPIDVQIITMPDNPLFKEQATLVVFENKSNQIPVWTLLKPGNDIQLYVGYSKQYKDLRKIFAGYIRQIQRNNNGTVTVIAEGYGSVLQRPLFSKSVEEINDDPRQLVVYQLDKVQSKQLGHIDYKQMGDILKLTLVQADSFQLETAQGVILPQLSIQPFQENIYFPSEYWTGIRSGNKGMANISHLYFANFEMHFARYEIKAGSSAWDVIFDQTTLQPDFIQQVEPIAAPGQARLFFGKPEWPFKFQPVKVEPKLVDQSTKDFFNNLRQEINNKINDFNQNINLFIEQQNFEKLLRYQYVGAINSNKGDLSVLNALADSILYNTNNKKKEAYKDIIRTNIDKIKLKFENSQIAMFNLTASEYIKQSLDLIKQDAFQPIYTFKDIGQALLQLFDKTYTFNDTYIDAQQYQDFANRLKESLGYIITLRRKTLKQDKSDICVAVSNVGMLLSSVLDNKYQLSALRQEAKKLFPNLATRSAYVDQWFDHFELYAKDQLLEADSTFGLGIKNIMNGVTLTRELTTQQDQQIKNIINSEISKYVKTLNDIINIIKTYPRTSFSTPFIANDNSLSEQYKKSSAYNKYTYEKLVVIELLRNVGYYNNSIVQEPFEKLNFMIANQLEQLLKQNSHNNLNNDSFTHESSIAYVHLAGIPALATIFNKFYNKLSQQKQLTDITILELIPLPNETVNFGSKSYTIYKIVSDIVVYLYNYLLKMLYQSVNPASGTSKMLLQYAGDVGYSSVYELENYFMLFNAYLVPKSNTELTLARNYIDNIVQIIAHVVKLADSLYTLYQDNNQNIRNGINNIRLYLSYVHLYQMFLEKYAHVKLNVNIDNSIQVKQSNTIVCPNQIDFMSVFFLDSVNDTKNKFIQSKDNIPQLMNQLISFANAQYVKIEEVTQQSNLLSITNKDNKSNLQTSNLQQMSNVLDQQLRLLQDSMNEIFKSNIQRLAQIKAGWVNFTERGLLDQLNLKLYPEGTKPFADLYLIHDQLIIRNNIRLNDNVSNAVTLYSTPWTKSLPQVLQPIGIQVDFINTLFSPLSTSAEKLEDKKVQVVEQYFDNDIPEEYIKRTTVVTHYGNIPQTRILIATSYLKKSLEEMYDGEIITLGIPGIKPYDYVYINDTYRGMFGMQRVKAVTQLYSPEHGFVTSIKIMPIIDTRDLHMNSLGYQIFHISNLVAGLQLQVKTFGLGNLSLKLFTKSSVTAIKSLAVKTSKKYIGYGMFKQFSDNWLNLTTISNLFTSNLQTFSNKQLQLSENLEQLDDVGSFVKQIESSAIIGVDRVYNPVVLTVLTENGKPYYQGLTGSYFDKITISQVIRQNQKDGIILAMQGLSDFFKQFSPNNIKLRIAEEIINMLK